MTDSSNPRQVDEADIDLLIQPQPMTSGTIYTYNVSYDEVGNVTSFQDATYPGTGPGIMGSWNMAGGYDSLNRLAGAGVTWPDGTQQYMCWQYDDFGNRLQQEISSSPFQSGSGGANACNPQSTAWVGTDLASYLVNGSDPGTNRIQSSNAHGITATPNYDGSGDLIWDGQNTYLYDAEGRICAVESNTYPGITTMIGYLYDADGTRIAKGTINSMNCDPTTNGFQFTENYVLGPGGEELTMLDGSNNWQRTNVYAGGKLLATYDMVGNPTYTPTNGQPIQIPGLHFHLEDPLGTRRMQISGNVNNLGQPETDFQSLPFGDQLSVSPDLNADQTAEQNTFGSTPLFFTGKERDAESGNDYFKYRYYASSMGRWLSPDPSGLTHADLGNPQSLNLYNYVGNRPLTVADLDGLCWKGFQWACDLGSEIKNLGIEAKNKIGYGEWTTNTTQAIMHKLDRDEAKARKNSYRKETQSVPDADDDRPQLTAMVKGVARNTAGFPDVCSGGVFFVKGREVSAGEARGEVGVITEVDSKSGTSVGGLAEGSGGDGASAGGGAIVGTGGPEGFAFIGPEADIGVGEAGAGVVGFSSGGVGVYAQGGAFGRFNEVGAYVNISTMGGCAQHK